MTSPRLTLNPTRFAKLEEPGLRSIAKEWFGMESAFGMALNVATLQGRQNFAASIAKDIRAAPLAQSFYLYRSGGLIKQALDLMATPALSAIASKSQLPGLALDTIAFAKRHNPDFHIRLLETLIASNPDARMMSPSTHAFLYNEVRMLFGDAAAEKVTGSVATSKATTENIRIAGLTRFRDEGELVIQCIGNLLEFCDFVIVYGSSNGESEKARDHFGADRVEVLTPPESELPNEQAINDGLFAAARAHHATHMVMIDADERASPRLADPKVIRDRAARLHPGDVLTVPFRQVFGPGIIDYRAFEDLNDISRLLPPHKDFLYCDDGQGTHRAMPLHNPFLPEGYPTRRHFITDELMCLLHFEKTNPLNALIKTDWYITHELCRYRTPLPMVLARYLPAHIVYNTLLDAPPSADPLASTDCAAYSCLMERRVENIRVLLPHIPPPARFLLNFTDYK